MAKKVLIVDRPDFQKLWLVSLGKVAEVIFACSTEEARKKFSATSDVFLIAIAVHLSNAGEDTVGLVREFRTSFTGLMFAISPSSDIQPLIDAGCDHGCGRIESPRMIRQILAE